MSIDPKDWIELLMLWGTFLAALVTIIALIAGFNLWWSSKQFKEISKEAKATLSQADKDLEKMEARVQSVIDSTKGFRSPKEILDDSRDYTDTHVRNLGDSIQRLRDQLDGSSSEVRRELGTLRRELAILQLKVPEQSVSVGSGAGRKGEG